MKNRIGALALTAYFLGFAAFVAILGFFWYQNNHVPEQPINFSHQIHVSKVGLECTHCHQSVEKSTFAGIPSVQTCMECHSAVATDKPEIIKLTKYWDEKLPIPWLRVYQIPARKYVHFSHKRHVKAGLDCSKCHGEVKVMPVIKRVREMEMGWCVSCHKENNAPLDCATCHK